MNKRIEEINYEIDGHKKALKRHEEHYKNKIDDLLKELENIKKAEQKFLPWDLCLTDGKHPKLMRFVGINYVGSIKTIAQVCNFYEKHAIDAELDRLKPVPVKDLLRTLLQEKWRYVATDKNGTITAYTGKPVKGIGNECFCSYGIRGDVLNIDDLIRPYCPLDKWEDSILKLR